MVKSLIVRVDMAQGRDSNGNLIEGVNFSNLPQYLKDQLGSYPKNAIIMLSPFHTPDGRSFEKSNRITGIRKENFVKGSIYSPNRLFTTKDSGDIELDFNEALEGGERTISAISEQAKSNGSIIMYDLVLNQIGTQSEQLEELKQKFKERYPNNTTGLIDSKNKFEGFDYGNEEVRDFIFEELHKPLIDKLIELGIRGVRIDAAGHVNIKYQEKVSEYLNQKFKEIGEHGDVVLEHMHSDGGITQDDCLKCWNKENLSSTLTVSNFLGIKLSEEEKEISDGYPKWVKDSAYSISLDRTSGMIGNHDEHNLHSKVASLIARQSLSNSGYPKEGKIYSGEDSSVTARQLFNGNVGGLDGPELTDTSGILTIENQLKILNGEIKSANFAGFGVMDRERLIKIYRAKAIEIAHSEIETNAQTMINIGPMGDLSGTLGSNSVFSKSEDFDNGKARILPIAGQFPELNVSKEVMNMVHSKRTTLSPGQWMEKVIVFSKDNPEYKFTSVIIKHLDNKYYDGEKLEISYASSDGKALSEKDLQVLKQNVADEIRARRPDLSQEKINSAIDKADFYNSMEDTRMDKVNTTIVNKMNDNNRANSSTQRGG